MKLFEIIPKSLFSALTSSNRFIYIDVLFLLLKETEIGNPIRSEFVDMLLAEMADRLTTFDISADSDGDGDAPESLEARAFAQFILRKLKRAGWIRMEADPESLEEMLRFPFYATSILMVLKEIEDDEVKEYASNIYGSYAALNDANQKNPENMFTALTIVERNMRQLRRDLDMLDGKVYALYQQLIDEVRINSILTQHFDEYQRELQQKLIHPLMTFDSVARFKVPIYEVLQEWQEGAEKFARLCAQAEDSHRFRTKEEARDDVAGKLVAIQDVYPKLEELVRQVGKRANAYTARTREKIAYYLNADQSLYSDMLRVMDMLAHSDPNAQVEITSSAADRFPLATGCFVDERSLFRTNKVGRNREVPAAITEIQGEKAPLDAFLKEARRHLTEKQIRSYVMRQLEGRDSVEARDMRVDRIEDFECLLMGAMRADDAHSPYEVEYEASDFECARYRIPDMRFSRKADR
jgi:hypothetical protein